VKYVIVGESLPEDSNDHPDIDLTIKHKALRSSRLPLTRLHIFAIWILVTILAAITGHQVSWHLFEIASGASIAFFLWPFVQGPYLLYTRRSLPLRADYRIFTGEIGPEYPKHRIDALFGLGFRYAGQLVQAPRGRNVAVHVAMFIHPANQDSVQLGRIVSGLRTTHALVFKARFDDGFAFESSNSHTAQIFRPDPCFPVFRFPALRSTTDLYRLHRKIKEQFALSHSPTLAEADEELSEFIARAEIVRQRHAQGGDYKLAPAGDKYVYTWRGAIRHAWLQTWPIKPFRAMRVHSRGMKRAKELGLPIHPKFGRLQDSLPRRDATVPRRRRL
jgi:hypothetical protein